MNENQPQPCKIKEISGKRYRCYFELTLAVIGDTLAGGEGALPAS